jgi:hypothetical protein
MLRLWSLARGLLVAIPSRQQADQGKRVVVLSAKPVLPWRCEDEKSFVIRQKHERKRAAEARVSQTMHGILLLLDPSMVLLQAIIEGCVRWMLHMVAQGFTHCPWVAGMTIRCHPFGCMTDNSECLLEKALSGFHISLLARAWKQPHCHRDRSPETDHTISP